MKIKVSLVDKTLFKDYVYFISIIGLFFSFVSIGINIHEKYKIWIGLGVFFFLILIYIGFWINANLKRSNKIQINNSTVEIKVGNIFEEEGLKVIAFNEYFDTLVDNKLIAERSLNGQYIKQKVPNIGELDRLIKEDNHLKEHEADVNNGRRSGKKQKYKLGTIFVHNNDYFLTAFAKFDDDDKAYLYINDYVNFLMNFWNEVDTFYADRTITIPLIGAGITRFKEYSEITDQELLELLLWSFRISKIKFNYPSKVSIIIHESKAEKINFYKLKELI